MPQAHGMHLSVSLVFQDFNASVAPCHFPVPLAPLDSTVLEETRTPLGPAQLDIFALSDLQLLCLVPAEPILAIARPLHAHLALQDIGVDLLHRHPLFALPAPRAPLLLALLTNISVLPVLLVIQVVSLVMFNVRNVQQVVTVALQVLSVHRDLAHLAFIVLEVQM